MSTATIWLTIIGLTAVTFLTRAGFLLLPVRFRLPPLIQRALRYAPVCALTAIVVPDLVLNGGAIDLSAGNVRLIAGVLAGLVFYRTRNMIVCIAVGMLAFTALRLWL